MANRDEKIGARIVKHRSGSQEDFAKRLTEIGNKKYTRDLVAKWETDNKKQIKSEDLIVLAKALGCTSDYLLGLEDEPTHEGTDIEEYTGLTENIINYLHASKLEDKKWDDEFEQKSIESSKEQSEYLGKEIPPVSYYPRPESVLPFIKFVSFILSDASSSAFRLSKYEVKERRRLIQQLFYSFFNIEQLAQTVDYDKISFPDEEQINATDSVQKLEKVGYQLLEPDEAFDYYAHTIVRNFESLLRDYVNYLDPFESIAFERYGKKED